MVAVLQHKTMPGTTQLLKFEINGCSDSKLKSSRLNHVSAIPSFTFKSQTEQLNLKHYLVYEILMFIFSDTLQKSSLRYSCFFQIVKSVNEITDWFCSRWPELSRFTLQLKPTFNTYACGLCFKFLFKFAITTWLKKIICTQWQWLSLSYMFISANN